MQGEGGEANGYIRFVNLNDRSLVGELYPEASTISTRFVERRVRALYGGDRAGEIWAPCEGCIAQQRCEARRANQVFGPDTLPTLAPEALRQRARDRLLEALQAVHFRGEVHVTTRELRAALVYILFGIHFCDDYHRGTEALPYWDRPFAPDAPARQGEVLAELARFDPALEAHPKLDRYLSSVTEDPGPAGPPRYPELLLASARRRAFFEWLEADIEAVAGSPRALGLARGQHLYLFPQLPFLAESEKASLCERLCRGIARLENLPPQAYRRSGVVPLRVTTRTPTETAFWVEKPLE
ncbi:MAG: hypothetical protein N3C12_01425 [Candidatus Binatia bacterium]|nr:hypothetical protein [Candidatus Binatia bacterium]